MAKREFLNSYRCDCGEVWEDVWCATCDDRCPKCNASNSPVSSEGADTTCGHDDCEDVEEGSDND